MENRSDGFTAIEDRYAGYTVYDNAGSKIGKVDDLFLDENDAPEYIGVKMGFLGTKSTLIPMEVATTDESAGTITVSTDKETAKNGPSFAGTVGSGKSMGDTESGEFREHDAGDEGVGQSRGDDLADEDELRVQRSEEELRAGTREREAG